MIFRLKWFTPVWFWIPFVFNHIMHHYHLEASSSLIQFWSGFIPVNGAGRINPSSNLSNSHSPKKIWNQTRLKSTWNSFQMINKIMHNNYDNNNNNDYYSYCNIVNVLLLKCTNPVLGPTDWKPGYVFSVLHRFAEPATSWASRRLYFICFGSFVALSLMAKWTAAKEQENRETNWKFFLMKTFHTFNTIDFHYFSKLPPMYESFCEASSAISSADDQFLLKNELLGANLIRLAWDCTLSMSFVTKGKKTCQIWGRCSFHNPVTILFQSLKL